MGQIIAGSAANSRSDGIEVKEKKIRLVHCRALCTWIFTLSFTPKANLA